MANLKSDFDELEHLALSFTIRFLRSFFIHRNHGSPVAECGFFINSIEIQKSRTKKYAREK